MARRKRRRRRGKAKIPIATATGLLGSLSVKGASGKSVIDALLSGNINDILYEVREKFAGVDANGQFQPHWLVETYTPVIIGAMVSKFVGGWPINLNQRLKDIPFVKI